MKGIKRDLKKILKEGKFDGCYYLALDENYHADSKDDLYLVLAYDENDELVGKIAYNCDDLQCDYDYDWEEPTTKDGDYIGNEWYDITNLWTLDELIESVKKSYKFIRASHWKHNN